jgi:hypothetical protein
LIDLYVGQVLRTRLAGGPSQLPTSLACVIDCDSKGRVPVSLEAFNAARIRCHWKLLEPDEGQPLWDRVDSQLASARRNGMTIHAGPLIDLREEMLPDWLTLRRDDFDTILSMSVDFVKSVLMHYRGRIPVWTLVHRAGCSDAMGLSEEDQIRLTARLLQVARQTDPGAQFLVGFDRPWAEWMTAGRFQLGPLHLADYLARSDLGLSGIELEIAPGFGRPGSLYRDVFDFSKLLDLFALVNLPIAVNLAIPSNSGSDPQAAPGIVVEAAEWPEPPGEASQLQIASAWISLAVAKPFVRSVTWSTLTDDHAHLYPFSGLHHDSTRPKQLAAWLADFRRRLLA